MRLHLQGVLRNYRPSQGHLHIVTTCLEFCEINEYHQLIGTKYMHSM
jgi:hypothetical protein